MPTIVTVYTKSLTFIVFRFCSQLTTGFKKNVN